MADLNVLVVDDESRMRMLVKDFLHKKNYNVIEAGDGEEAIDIFFSRNDISLVILDVMMPKMDGWETCREIRKFSKVPIIMLTAKSEDADKVMGLTIGADDYVTKPFNPVELMARVKSQIRRYTLLGASTGAVNDNDSVLKIGGIELNDKAKEVTLDGELVNLTPLEFDILKLLMTHKGEVFSPRDIYEKVWNETVIGAESTVAVHIRHLREKLEYDSANPRYLKAVWGHGYKIDD